MVSLREQWRQLSGPQDPGAYGTGIWQQTTDKAEKMSAYGASISPQDIEEAEALVADQDMLWSQFLQEMSRFGIVEEIETGGVAFVAAEESTARTFLITPVQLREALVIHQAHEVHSDHHPMFMNHLPQWFVDDLWETIGSREEPYDEPYMMLDDGKPTPSIRRERPAVQAAPASLPTESQADGGTRGPTGPMVQPIRSHNSSSLSSSSLDGRADVLRQIAFQRLEGRGFQGSTQHLIN